MKSKEFLLWLQGYLEVQNPETITGDQLVHIKNKLNLVFQHEIDPSFSNDPKVQNELQEIHDKGKGKLSIFPEEERMRC